VVLLRNDFKIVPQGHHTYSLFTITSYLKIKAALGKSKGD